MAQLEKQLKEAYYGGFEDNYTCIAEILNGAVIDSEIWLLWLPHKPLSNMVMQTYGNGNIKVEATW